MTEYRFITRNRHGKWYPNIRDAQVQASKIGAGFLDSTGEFFSYRGTILEFRASPNEAAQERMRNRNALPGRRAAKLRPVD